MKTIRVDKLRVAIALMAGGAILGGCATHDTRKAEAAKEYCAEKYADPRLAPLKDKIVMPISVDEPQPIDILANKTRPTEQERAAIKVLADIRAECNARLARDVSPPPAYRVRSQDEISSELADLYAGDITYGQFAKSLLYIGDRDKAAREDVDQAIQQRERWRVVDVYN